MSMSEKEPKHSVHNEQNGDHAGEPKNAVENTGTPSPLPEEEAREQNPAPVEDTEPEPAPAVQDAAESVPDHPEKAPEDEAPHESRTKPQAQKVEVIHYSLLSRGDLVKVLQELLDKRSVSELKGEVEPIRVQFYKKYKAELEEKKKEFVDKGGNPEQFQPEEDADEALLKELLKKYREMRFEFSKLAEDEKELNLKTKQEIIEEIKELVHRDESINKTFQDFRDLQKRWHETGAVPQPQVKELWENYHHHVEKFYDYIKINNELRDLDLKKNFELKTGLCEKAEALLLENNIINAFQSLQKLHDQWREIGPVPKDKRSEIWERFREATSRINKKHQSYYQDLRETQKKNLDAKVVLCEKAEEVVRELPSGHDEWVKKTDEILELQKVWKSIGFAPKKDNNRIYERFRTACDRFFEQKRAFYAQTLDVQQKNLQMKLDLCTAAERLKESTDWKNASDELIRLQKKWKTIGPVPRKQSDEVWKRFRLACDTFFNRKNDFFSNIDSSYESNLKLKEELIAETESLILSDDLKANLAMLNELQRRWAEIGFVPLNRKEEVNQKFRDAINLHYDSLKMDDHRRNMIKFKHKLQDMMQNPKAAPKLRFEREKLMNKLQQLKSDIGVWENNIGFFANTRNAEVMIKDFEQKITSAREKIKLLEDKIIAIDEVDND